jgi:hypothetical protein
VNDLEQDCYRLLETHSLVDVLRALAWCEEAREMAALVEISEPTAKTIAIRRAIHDSQLAIARLETELQNCAGLWQ